MRKKVNLKQDKFINLDKFPFCLFYGVRGGDISNNNKKKSF